MDLALAHVARAASSPPHGTQLDAWQLRALTYACRAAKEQLLARPDAAEARRSSCPSRGSQADRRHAPHRAARARSSTATARSTASSPRSSVASRPRSRARAGLDAAGAALRAGRGGHAPPGGVPRPPGAGARRARRLRRRTSAGKPSSTRPRCCSTAASSRRSAARSARAARCSTAGSPRTAAPAARVLEGADLDLAVARGAAYYGWVRQRPRRAHPRRHGARVLRRRRESRCRRCPGMRAAGARRCAWRRSAWRKAPRPTCRRRSSAWWSASRCASASSARRCGARTASATLLERWSSDELRGARTPSRRRCRPRAARPGEVVPVQLQAARHRGRARSSSKPCRAAAASAGRSSSTCAANASAVRLTRERARYIVGIDLGTTHTRRRLVDAVARRAGRAAHRGCSRSPQLVAPGRGRARGRCCRRCVYHPAAGELAPRRPRAALGPRARRRAVVGELARWLGAQVPGRLVASREELAVARRRRSPGADPARGARRPTCRRSRRSTPARATSRTCARAWNARASRSTARASRRSCSPCPPRSTRRRARSRVKRRSSAGLPQLRLLEEPQAAFYDWHRAPPRDARRRRWRACGWCWWCDVGGGTTDFTLVHVERARRRAACSTRIAVGDHLMLGGDNMDLALAHRVEEKLVARRHAARRRAVDAARRRPRAPAKEALLGDDAARARTACRSSPRAAGWSAARSRPS